jgi:hypothetical protein
VCCIEYLAWKKKIWWHAIPPKPPGVKIFDPGGDFTKLVSEVRAEAHAATKSSDPVVIQKAIDRLMKLSEEADKFTEVMKNHPNKESRWNDTQVGIYFDNTVKLSDVLSMKMTLRKNLAAISDQTPTPPKPPAPPEPERRD